MSSISAHGQGCKKLLPTLGKSFLPINAFHLFLLFNILQSIFFIFFQQMVKKHPPYEK